jgi:predicted RNase H-like HicB family nuclease
LAVSAANPNRPKSWRATHRNDEANDRHLLFNFLTSDFRRPQEAAKLGGIQLNEGFIMRQVVISHGQDGYWIAECPSLPGCISQGQTREDALQNIKEAIEGYIAALEEDGIPVPDDHLDTLVVAV